MNIRVMTLFLLLLGMTAMVFSRERTGDDGRLNKPGIIGQIERMDVNRLNVPFENNGDLGSDGQSWFPNGQTTLSFLFAGGPAMSGYVGGELRTAWVASASRIIEMQPGRFGTDPDAPEAKFYVVDNRVDGFGSQAYVDWADAVAQGAEFQDLDGDGLYDPNVDRPDIIGDKIIWTVFNDGTGGADRARLNTPPMGVEVQQLIWAFERGDALGNVIFIRYRMINATDQDIEDFIFTAWVDPDLGPNTGYLDDLIGSNIDLSLGYIYNDGEDDDYGPNPPAFGIDFFQGPVVESPGDTAFLARGPFFGVDTLLDARNLPLTSYMFYIQSDPTIGDPNTAQQARWYQEGGLDASGAPIVPGDWGIGGTDNPDSNYFYNGDPVAGTGWLDNTPADKRFMVNTGPFQLAARDTQDVVVAYIVSRGGDAIGSVRQLFLEDQLAQASYDNNFLAAPPMPQPTVDNGGILVKQLDQRIELIIDLKRNYEFQDQADVVGTVSWEGLKIYQLRTTDTQSETVNGQPNIAIIGRYDLDNEYGDLYELTPDALERIYEAQNNLDYATYEMTGSGLLKVVIETDAFTGQPLINFKTYNFAVQPFGINSALAQPNETTAAADDYILPGGPATNPINSGLFSAVPARAENSPFKAEAAERVSGSSEGYARAEVLDQGALTGHNYTISFFDNGNQWRVTNESTGEVAVDSVAFQGTTGEELTFPIVDGISMQVFNVPNALKEAVIDSASAADTVWVQGRSNSGFGDSTVFSNGVDLVTLVQDQSPLDVVGLNNQIQKADYFPVEIVFDSQDSYAASFYARPALNATTFAPNAYGGVRDIFIAAYDVSDPDNPRQLNIVYNAAGGNLSFNSGNSQVLFICNSDYDASGAIYDIRNNPDARDFKEEAYMVMNVELVPGQELRQNRFSVTVTPYRPNADNDAFTVQGSELLPTLTRAEEENLLDKVKVVPNPYFAYSGYESSYDTPVLKFTHLSGPATIRVFNIAGQLIRTIRKDNDVNEATWDLRNEAGLRIASGMYIAHIEVDGVGEKVIKFGVIQREDRIDRF